MGELQLATLGTGCFWCSEAIYKQLRGVEKVVSGYAGGHVDNPTYEQVSSGDTGEAECVQISFNPDQISYADLLEVFWRVHDPTTPNRQGADVGTQYRSIILYHNDEQKQIAEESLKKADAEKIYPDPIVTEIKPYTGFYPAEDYHQNFYETNPNQRYCKVVIDPKVTKFKKQFADKLKS